MEEMFGFTMIASLTIAYYFKGWCGQLAKIAHLVVFFGYDAARLLHICRNRQNKQTKRACLESQLEVQYASYGGFIDQKTIVEIANLGWRRVNTSIGD